MGGAQFTYPAKHIMEGSSKSIDTGMAFRFYTTAHTLGAVYSVVQYNQNVDISSSLVFISYYCH